jgi:hypothetical protein
MYKWFSSFHKLLKACEMKFRKIENVTLFKRIVCEEDIFRKIAANISSETIIENFKLRSSCNALF